jgi:hypothetical protein
MDSYLKKEKNPNSRSRKQNENDDSSPSRSSVGSEQRDAVDAVIAGRDALNKVVHSERRPLGRLPSPELHSTASSGTEQRTATLHNQISRIPPTIDVVLAAAPIVQPMRTGITLPYMDFSPLAFQSIGNPQKPLGKPLDPFRTMFQASHPLISVEELKFHCMYAR